MSTTWVWQIVDRAFDAAGIKKPEGVGTVHVLRRGSAYQDLGDKYFDERDRQRTLQRSVRRIERLGYAVTLEAA